MNKFILTVMLFTCCWMTACKKVDMTEPGALVPRTVDQDPSLPALSINGTLLHVETHGNPTDPVLIMVHGGPGGDYRSLLHATDFVNDGFYVVFYDQRGTGLSKREDKSQYENKDAVQLYMDDLDALGAGNRNMCAGRELTKQFETFYRGLGDAVFAQIRQDPNAERGEWAWVIEGSAISEDEAASAQASADLDTWLALLMAELPLKTAVAVVVKATGLAKNTVYNRALEIKDSRE